MQIRPDFALSVAAAAALLGCAAQGREKDLDLQCLSAKHCTVSGIATAEPLPHAWMARLDLSEGRCIAVSLPAAQIERLRTTGPQPMRVTGRVYGDPSHSGAALMRIEGRSVGVGLCGGIILFVPD